ncbi:uncharacterized protein DFL_004978 [Arthrobotrys flagrans]|uniref:Uncharacterized protein n=1 Tax=Arthrobotrys flagrans TaxID=97331 RepID=A0A437A6H7_ARTFL|nr:hypothetical protein DFL_004978 [Arthrobotrys flagrans]
MASRAVLHHAALKITPPPRTLRESREIYRTLRKFGEIDLYRSLRHETSTLEAKDDAIVLFRDEAALGEAFEASPINVSMPTAQPSPIPSSSLSTVSTPADPPFSDKFTIEISKREHNHETRIIDQLFAAPYSVTQETPPGASIGSNSKSDISRAPDANEYRTNLTRATGGGWKSWRLEMKQAGIPTWSSIKPTSDVVVAAPLESSTSRSRINSVGWSRPSDTYDIGTQDAAQPVLPKSISSTISNPTPLPLDPTLQPFRRQRQSQTGGAHGSQSTMRSSTGWWRGATQAEGRSSHLPSQQDQSGASSISESSNQSSPGPISSKTPAQNESESIVAIHPLNFGSTSSAISEGLTGSADNTFETGLRPDSSDVNALSIKETKQPAKANLENVSEPMPGHETPRIHGAQTLEQNNAGPIFVRDVTSHVEQGLEEQSLEKAEASIDIRTNEKTSSKEAPPEQTNQSKPQHAEAITTERVTAPAKKKWWSLPWQK